MVPLAFALFGAGVLADGPLQPLRTKLQELLQPQPSADAGSDGGFSNDSGGDSGGGDSGCGGCSSD